MRKLLVYGDSNSHGTKPLQALGAFERYDPGVPWPDVMAAELPDWQVITEALPGRTTVLDDPVWGLVRNGLTVLPAVLLSHVPVDAVMIVLGTNDLKAGFGSQASDIVRGVMRLGAEIEAHSDCRNIAIAAPLPVREAGCLAPVFEGVAARQAGLAQALREAAEEAGYEFVDFAPHGEVSNLDGVHWAADTHASVGRAAAAFVREVWP